MFFLNFGGKSRFDFLDTVCRIIEFFAFLYSFCIYYKIAHVKCVAYKIIQMCYGSWSTILVQLLYIFSGKYSNYLFTSY